MGRFLASLIVFIPLCADAEETIPWTGWRDWQRARVERLALAKEEMSKIHPWFARARVAPALIRGLGWTRRSALVTLEVGTQEFSVEIAAQPGDPSDWSSALFSFHVIRPVSHFRRTTRLYASIEVTERRSATFREVAEASWRTLHRLNLGRRYADFAAIFKRAADECLSLDG